MAKKTLPAQPESSPRASHRKGNYEKMPDGWACAEPGWWVHDALGGVCREADRKWYRYPKDRSESDRLGPFLTAGEAASVLVQPMPTSLIEKAQQLPTRTPGCSDEDRNDYGMYHDRR